MNFNAQTNRLGGLGRKVKRVSDVNSMGYNPQEQPLLLYPDANENPQFIAPKAFSTPISASNFAQVSHMQQNEFNHPQSEEIGRIFAPAVKDAALQYGQQLASTGTTLFKQEVDKYVPLSILRSYFSVDTSYVMAKLKLLTFPYMHKDWSVKYEPNGMEPVQPRYEINVPDLYIPTMAYFTYILIASVVLGLQQQFKPEQLSILASNSLAWWLVEVALYKSILYLTTINTCLRTFDLLAYSGYKFFSIVLIIGSSLLGGSIFYYTSLIYLSISLAFFLTRSLKLNVLGVRNAYTEGSYTCVQSGRRGHYFLLLIALLQPVIMWWLTFHLNRNTAIQENQINT